jgi:hypothetical protein
MMPSERHKFASVRLERGILNFATGYPKDAQVDFRQAMHDATLDDARIVLVAAKFHSTWYDALVQRMAAPDIDPAIRQLWDSEIEVYRTYAAD